jgi:S-formylglutathione hydrolase FrmB
MGGFGALHLATRQRFCAAGGHSPALWRSGGETPEGAFDDAEDFDDATPFGKALLTETVWLDVGTEDPFREATLAFGEQSGERVRVSDGGHDSEYWDDHMREYIRFYARALERCDA